MDADHKTQFSGALFLASQVTLLLISIPAFLPKSAKVIAFLAVGWYFYRVIFTQTTGHHDNDFGLGSVMLFQYIGALDYAFFTPPDSLRDLHDNDPTTVTKRPLKKRALWVLKLYSNPRGIGWAHEISNLPPRPSPSTPRSIFVASRVLLAACSYLMVYGAHLLDTSYTNLLTVGSPLHLRLRGVLSFGLGGAGLMTGNHAVAAAIVVGCGFSSPERWPLLFGSPLQCWNISRFWRRFWHQMIRRCVLTCTSSFLGCFCSEKSVGTTGYKLARLYIVFFLSGLAHLGGDVMASGKLGFNAFTFFMLQPFGITIEIVVSYLWHRLQGDVPNATKTIAYQAADHTGRSQEKNRNVKSLAEEPIPPLWIRCVGFIWLAAWMVWSAAYLVDGLYSARISASTRA